MAFLAQGVKVNIQSNTANSVAITGITNAANCVVACAGHTHNVGDIVIIESVVGLPRINNSVARVAAKTSANVTLEGLNTTDFGTYVSGGTIKSVKEWVPFDNITNFNFQEPQPNRQQILTIHDETASELFGADSAPQVTMDVYSDAFNAAVTEVREASEAKTNRAFEVIFKNGYKLYLNAQVAGGRGVQASAGQAATGQISLAVQGAERWYQS